MRLLLIGAGAREHVILRRLKQNPQVEKIYVLPGNGGMAKEAECVPIPATAITEIVAFAKAQAIDFAVVVPDDPLAAGLVDALELAAVPCFGPRKDAALIESSKAFAKNLMQKYQIPTAAYKVFDDLSAAQAYVETAAYPLVIKADGLALGKGVFIVNNLTEAAAALRSLMLEERFGSSGKKVVIEEYLTGIEVSVLTLTDGEHILPLTAAQDHKRSGEGDSGLNTGGMGAIAPHPAYTPEIAKQCYQEIFLPTIRALAKEKRTFKGCLYFGLILTAAGPKVIEYNARFGDPETQAVLPLLKNDLLDLMLKIRFTGLADVSLDFFEGAAACVCLANAGYPLTYKKNLPLSIPQTLWEKVAVAGCALPLNTTSANSAAKNLQFLAVGGRLLSVTNVAPDLATALAQTYEDLKQIDYEAAYYRKDIGRQALAYLERDVKP